MIELSKVGKRYGAIQALTDVTADIEGRVIGLLGPNGAGKSTLLKVMLGLVEYEGDAKVFEMSSRTSSFAIRDRVGYMPEMDSYIPGMNAVEICTFAGELGGLPRREAMQRAHEALYYAGLGDKRYQKVDGYSTGLKQRVKLAQSLVHDPELLFLDEPTNGLDPRARDDMLELITELPTRRECSIILSTHLLPDVERVCESVVIMQQGRMRFSGTIDALRGTGRADTYDIEVKADIGPLSERLVAAGCEVEPESPMGATVTVPVGQDARLIFREAREAGAQVRHCAAQTVSLESAFLRQVEADE